MILLEEFEKVQLIQDLAPDHLKKLAQAGELREFKEEDTIFQEGESCYWMFIILDGEVDLSFKTPEKEVHIQVLGPGDLLGWSPLLFRGRMTATAKAISRCRIAALNVRELHHEFDEDSKFGKEFYSRVALALALRLNATRRKFLEKS